MGMHIERVPSDYKHPVGSDGGPIPGGHKRVLRKLRDDECTAFQVYEDTTDGTPISPVFESASDLRAWLLEQGHSPAAVDNFMIVGVASSLFFKDGIPVNGIEALAVLTKTAAQEIAAERRTSIRRPRCG